MLYQDTTSLPDEVQSSLPAPALQIYCTAANHYFGKGYPSWACNARALCVVKDAGYHQSFVKNDPGGSSVHVDSPLGSGKKKPKKTPPAKTNMDISVKMNKDSSEKQQICYGWASVISIDGRPIVDTDGDIIEASELENAVNKFMETERDALVLHDGEPIGRVLHSLPLTGDLAKRLGFDCDREGWIIGMKITDNEIWKLADDGVLPAFSIGGRAKRE
jgi:hypothetical protein